LTIAADNARFGQTGPKVGSFDGGFGASYLARIVGQKKAREIWYLCDQYDAQEALDMGLVNKVVPLDALEDTAVEWAQKNHQEKSACHTHVEVGLQRRTRRPGGHPGTRRQCHAAVLFIGGSERGQRCLPGEERSRLGEVPAVSLTSHDGDRY